MEWLSCLASSFGRDLVCGAAEQLRYARRFSHFVEDLQGVRDSLIRTRNSVNDRVERGKNQAMECDAVIHEWLKQKAKPLIDEVEVLLAKAATNKTCCFGSCPNWIWRYRLAKQLEEKKVEVETCIQQGKECIQLEHVAPLPSKEHVPWENCMKFDSRQGAYEKLMEALRDDEVSMIGLYGMGGCGKTTMAMELMSTVKAEHLFDEVIFVAVSSKVEVRSIQDKIASALQFQFPEDGERERAQRLHKRSTPEDKRALIILDDVWQFLDFAEIGIPSIDNCKNCKVMITTRSKDVCDVMDCQQMVCLSTLTDEEAWELFQKQARISENYPENLKELGRLISKECEGLPVAIAALAGTLKGKAEAHWKVALDRLRNAVPVNIEKGLQNPYKCLELSYDNLDTKEAKSLLLLCSVFPEDHEIPIEDLTVYAIGLGLVGEVWSSFEMARDEVSVAKDKLVSSSLLLSSIDADGVECVKMHDLIRDVAQWIGSKEDKAVKCELDKRKTSECSSIRYLWCTNLPNELDCSGIEFLRLKTNLEISDGFFKEMKMPRVLILHYDGFKRGSLSTMSFESMTNLRCLSLYCWELGDISSLVHMKKLESLKLIQCSFSEFNDSVITQLTNLRLLGLFLCGMKVNAFGAIGGHLKLEELYLNDISDSEFFKMRSVPQALRRYQIDLGDISAHDHTKQRILNLDCFDPSNAAIVELAKNAEVLHVANITGGAKNIIPDIFKVKRGGAMNYGWVKLFLEKSDEIECLVDASNLSPEVGSLSELRTIEERENLGTLYRGVPPSGLFEKLEQLYIRECPKLKCLLTTAAAKSLVQLQALKIGDCDVLKHIVEDDDSEITRHDDKLAFSKLKLLSIFNCPMLEYIFPATFAQRFMQLEFLDITNCENLEYVFKEGTHKDKSQNELKIELPFLKEIIIECNSKLISIFPKFCLVMCPSVHEVSLVYCPKLHKIPITFAQGFAQLKGMRIDSCDDLEFVFGHNTCGDESQNELKIELPMLEELILQSNSKLISIFPKFCFVMCPSLRNFHLGTSPKFDIMSINTFKFQDAVRDNEKHFGTLETLHIEENSEVESIFCLSGLDLTEVRIGSQCMQLSCLHEMKSICVGLKNYFPFQDLKTVEICGCEKLEVILPISVWRCLPKLEHLEIINCKELKQIIEEDDADDKKQSNLDSPKPCFPKLVYLYIEECNKLKCLFDTSVCACNDLPNLACLFVIGASKLEELIGSGQGTGEVKVEFPKLKSVVLVNLYGLCQRIELPSLAFRVVHNCPKLSLTSSIATYKDFRINFFESTRDLDNKSANLSIRILDFFESHNVFASEYKKVENPNEEGTTRLSIRPFDEHASSSEVRTTHSYGVMSVEDNKIKGNVQEAYALEVTTEASMAAGVEDNGFGVVAATHTETGSSQSQKKQNVDESKLTNKGEIGSIVVHQS